MNGGTNAVTTTGEVNILKCRDDHHPVMFRRHETGSVEDTKPFRLVEGSRCSWATQEEAFGSDKLRARIEPWLTALFQTEHLALLVGSGLSHAIHRIATGNALPGMSKVSWAVFDEEIQKEAKRSAAASGRDSGNIEDHIRIAAELLRGLEILASTKDKTCSIVEQAEGLRKSFETVLGAFAQTILGGETGVLMAPAERRERAFNYLVSFLMSFSSRSGTRDRLHLFTTNYDRFIEAGADVAGLHLIDRFVGQLSPVFRSSRLDVDLHYNPPGIRGEPRYLEGVARFTKLHGSVDWVDREKSIHRLGIPFGARDISPYLAGTGLPATARQLMIYPNSSKDRETAVYPYVELFRDLAAAVCRPNSTVICFGYSFGDEHINRVIEDMLTIPSTHLVIISMSDPLGRIMRTYERLGRPAQITLMLGEHVGNFEMLVDNYLPKPAIDRTTFRMAELLKARWDQRSHELDGNGDVVTTIGA